MSMSSSMLSKLDSMVQRVVAGDDSASFATASAGVVVSPSLARVHRRRRTAFWRSVRRSLACSLAFTALRLALEDRTSAKLIRAAQDVLTLLIYFAGVSLIVG